MLLDFLQLNYVPLLGAAFLVCQLVIRYEILELFSLNVDLFDQLQRLKDLLLIF
jgi:hypothetical protein